MRVLEARNVQQAFPQAILLLTNEGIRRETRNGPVLQAPWPVTTVYQHPCERVLFYPERDANPFFHLYESLWMLAGRNDVAGPVRYAKQMAAYSDDGLVFHGAYGYRWRRWFRADDPIDQLFMIANALRANSEDRRQILSMWDTERDLGGLGKDLPCNTIATFQRDPAGALDLTVFCRSNDIVWGCYGANAVHFAFLLEYMANWIGCPVGVYRQVSVNWHAYLNTFAPVSAIRPDRAGYAPNPYLDPLDQSGRRQVRPVPLPLDIPRFDRLIQELLSHVETGFTLQRLSNDDEPFIEMCYSILRAHAAYTAHLAPERFGYALDVLSRADQRADWVVAAREWILRRELAWVVKNAK